MRVLAVLSLVGLTLSGCDIPPSFVENSDIDAAMARSSFATVCKGLEMKDASTRSYAAMKLKSVQETFKRSTKKSDVHSRPFHFYSTS